MGIFIQNMGPTDDNETCDPQGEYNYQVKINDKLVCFFKHERHKGLAVCLSTASKAVSKVHPYTVSDFYTKLQGDK